MTIEKNVVALWDNGIDKLHLFAIPTRSQYIYTENLPCISFGVAYENPKFKGYDTFTMFDNFYTETLNQIEKTHQTLNGSFRIYDTGADTDGYIEFVMNKGKLSVKGQLGATFSSHSLSFELGADQTLVTSLLKALTI